MILERIKNHRIQNNSTEVTKTFDFNTLIGETIRHRYKTLTEGIISVMPKQYDENALWWLWASPEIAGMFITEKDFISENSELDDPIVRYFGRMPFYGPELHVVWDCLAPEGKFVIGIDDECYNFEMLNFAV